MREGLSGLVLGGHVNSCKYRISIDLALLESFVFRLVVGLPKGTSLQRRDPTGPIF